MFCNLPDDPPPAIPSCPVCGQPMEYVHVLFGWECVNAECPQGHPYDADYSLVAYEADQRARAAYLDSLDNAVEDDDCEDDW